MLVSEYDMNLFVGKTSEDDSEYWSRHKDIGNYRGHFKFPLKKISILDVRFYHVHESLRHKPTTHKRLVKDDVKNPESM